MERRKEALRIVYETLFPVKLLPDERVELVFDGGGDKVFKYAYHIESFQELEEFVAEYDGRVNIAICPNTRIPRKVAQRTGKEAVRRQRAVLLDIEDPNSHTKKSPDQVREMIREVVQKLPESIRKAVYYSAYTGGGGQLCIVLSRWIEAGEIDIVYSWLKKQLEGIRLIDVAIPHYQG